MKLAEAIGLIFFINLVFGYWRAVTRRFSWQWIAAIHVPVPMAIGIRFRLLGWAWPLIPVFAGVFAVGQFTGGKVRNRLSKQKRVALSAFLITDVIKLLTP